MIDRETTWSVYTKCNSKQKYLFSSKESDYRLFSIAQKYDLDKDEQRNKLFAITVGDIILGFYKIEDTVPLLQQELGLDPRTAALLGADVLDFLAPLSDPNWEPPAEEVRGEEDNELNTTEGLPQGLSDDYYDEKIHNPIQVTNNQSHKNPFSPAVTVEAMPQTTTNSPQTHQQTPEPKPYAQMETSPVQPRYMEQNPALHTMATDMEQARQGHSFNRATPTLNLEDTPTYVAQNQDSIRKTLSSTPTYTPTPQTTFTPTPANIEPPRWSTD